jgi:hypothetical protein
MFYHLGFTSVCEINISISDTYLPHVNEITYMIYNWASKQGLFKITDTAIKKI